MPFTAITLSDACAALAQRLGDTGFIRWTQPECIRYVTEALRTWNSFTQAYRRRAAFSLTANQAFYDLPTVAPAARRYTVTNLDLIADLQSALLEPVAPTTWTGSAQFTRADLTAAIQRRRDQFLRETAAVLTREVFTISPSPSGRHELPLGTLGVRRAAWTDLNNRTVALMRADEWSASHYTPTWTQQPRRWPLAYGTSTNPPMQVQLYPNSFDTGQIDLLLILAGADPSATTAVPLGVPDDWTWVIKFGALADLLSLDGLSADIPRAVYCESRWQHGLDLARRAAVVMTGRIRDVSVRVSAIADADRYNPLWQTTATTPKALITAGQNLLAVWPPPTSLPPGNYSVSVDLVANQPVTVVPSEYLALTADAVDTVLDYAQHLALFKEGGYFVTATRPLLDRFLRATGVSLIIQQAEQPARAPLTAVTTQQGRVQPDQQPDADTTLSTTLPTVQSAPPALP